MSDDWNWQNNEEYKVEREPEESAEAENLKEKEGSAEESVLQEESVQTENSAEESVSQTEPQRDLATEEDAMYHWVNPDYQRRRQQQMEDQESSYNQNSYGQNPYGQNSYGQNSYGQNPYGQNSYEQNSYGQNPYGQNSYGQNSYGEQSSQGPVTGKRRYESYRFSSEDAAAGKSVRNAKKEEKRKRRENKKSGGFGNRLAGTVVLAVIFGLVAGGVMYGVNHMAGRLSGDTQLQETEKIQIPSTDVPQQVQQDGDSAVSDTGEYTVAQVAANCMPSVVSITNASVTTVRDFFGGTQEYPVESSGSGIIVGQNDTELLIATNNHVVTDAKTLTVAFCDDTVYEAQAKGTDSAKDLAVLAVKLEDLSADTLSAIKVISIGDSDELQIGEQVVAIGNALGYGQSVTSGWISAKNREMEDSNGNSTGKLIQTDAAINPGNSGGALLNMRGELVGINSAKTASTDVEGMGYAIPISVAEPILDDLMNRKTRSKVEGDNAAYIGVTCLDVEASAAQRYGIPQGAFIDSIVENGPADQAGILRGDVIVKVDGVTISCGSDLVNCMMYYEAGEEVEVVLYRAENGSYEEKTVTATLGRKSEMQQ